MTLASFKNLLRNSLIVVLLILYAGVFFLLGKNTTKTSFLKALGVTTNKSIETPINSQEPYTDIQSTSITASYIKICANTAYGFEVSYPKDWFSTYNIETEKCNFFAPYSFIVPQETANFLIPISISTHKPEEWEPLEKFNENPNDFYNILSVENIQLGDRAVQKIEASSTGKGETKRGFIKTTYLVFSFEKPMVFTYTQLDEKEDIELGKRTLEDMVKSLKYF